MTYRELLDITKKYPNPFYLNQGDIKYYEYLARSGSAAKNLKPTAQSSKKDNTTEKARSVQNIQNTQATQSKAKKPAIKYSYRDALNECKRLYKYKKCYQITK